MLIDSYSASKLVRLHENLKEDEKIICRETILEIAKKERWEIWRDMIRKKLFQ